VQQLKLLLLRCALALRSDAMIPAPAVAVRNTRTVAGLWL